MRFLFVVASFHAMLITGCTGTVAPVELPANIVVGEYGGAGARVLAAAKVVHVSFGCEGIVFQRPLVPLVHNTFVLGPQVSASGGFAMSVAGVIDGDSLSFEAVRLGAAGDVRRSQYVVRRDQPGVVPTLCPLDGE